LCAKIITREGKKKTEKKIDDDRREKEKKGDIRMYLEN
jgi:ASC-1-like (ASCH) protein